MAAASGGPAAAAPGGTCSIVVTSGGVLAANAALTSLSSRNASGSPARLTITAAGSTCVPVLPNTCFHISVTVPTAFSTAPAGANSNVSFDARLATTGTSSALNLASLAILNGASALDFDLQATKSSGVFPVGSYQAQGIVRCE